MNRECTIVFEKNWDAIHAKNEDGSRRYRYIVNRGSSRSSKTISLIDCYDFYGRTEMNKRMTVWRNTKIDCKDTVLNDALKRFKFIGNYKILQEFNKTESVFTYTQTGSTFEIRGTDEENKIMGLTQDCAWFNEPYLIHRDIFDQIDQRTSDFIFIDYNPKKDHWVEDLMKDPRTIVIDSNFTDNPFCPPEQRAKILSYQPIKFCNIVQSKKEKDRPAVEQMLRSYDCISNLNDYTPKQIKELLRCRQNEFQNSASRFKWEVYGLGLKSEKPNRIFNWVEIPDHQYFEVNAKRYYGVDWGSVDPWGIVEVKYYDGCLYLHEKNYESENKIREKLTEQERSIVNSAPENEAQAQESVGLVTWHFAQLGIPKDCPLICDTNRPMKGAALRRAGWEVYPAIKPAGSILDGIDGINDLQAVYFSSSSTNLKYEQENYSRKVDRYGVVLDEPEDNQNHICDPVRYVFQYLQSIGIITRV